MILVRLKRIKFAVTISRIKEVEFRNSLVFADIDRTIQPAGERTNHVGLPCVIRPAIDIDKAEHIVSAGAGIVTEKPRHLILIAANTVQPSIGGAYQPINSILIERLAKIRNRELIRI